MLHLLPEIERIATDENHERHIKKKQRSPANGSQSARSASKEWQLHQDVLVAIRSECQALKLALDEGFRSMEVSQREALQQCMSTTTTTAVTLGSRQQVATSMENSMGSSPAASELALFTSREPANQMLGRPCLPQASAAGIPATLPGSNLNSHDNDNAQTRPPLVSSDSLNANDEDPLPDHSGVNFKQKADRMAERGHGGQELAEASGWGKQIPDDSQKESLFHKGMDICRFGQRDQMLRLVKSRLFELIVSIIILGNAFFMGINANMQLNAAKEARVENSGWLTLFEHFFTLIFALEWVFRFLAYQKWLFRVEDWKWHIFDTFLVGVSVVELVIEAAGSTSGGAGMLVLRLLRMIRLMRLLRIVRYITAFRELRLMTYGLFSSLRSWLWSFVLLGLVAYIFAIVFVQAAVSFLQKNNSMGDPPEKRDKLVDEFIEFFGSTQVSMRTLLVSISGGADWILYMYLLEQVDIVYSLLFLLYIMLVLHGVLHMIASIFVDSMLNTSKVEKDQLIREEMSAKDSYMSQIKILLEEADTNNSGTISWEEFQIKLEDAHMQEFLKNIELDITEARGLFKLLDMDESDEVPIDEFVTGCFRLKSSGKGLDLASIMHENKKMIRVFMQFMAYSQEQFEAARRERQTLPAGTQKWYQEDLERTRSEIKLHQENMRRLNEEKAAIDLEPPHRSLLRSATTSASRNSSRASLDSGRAADVLPTFPPVQVALGAGVNVTIQPSERSRARHRTSSDEVCTPRRQATLSPAAFEGRDSSATRQRQ